MNLTKDMYEYLLNFADDRDIINMLSVNKKFSDEELFERIMKRKYPDLIRFRRVNETWKQLFVRMVYYISLLKEKYEVDYFSGLFLPDVFRKGLNSIYIIIEAAAKVGNLEVVKKFINSNSKLFSLTLITAVRNNQINVVKYLLSQKPEQAITVGSLAASSGHIGIIQYLLESQLIETRDLNNFLAHAASGNQKETVDWLIEQGANDFDSAIDYARMSNHYDMAKYLQSFL